MIEQGVENVFQSENFREYLMFLSKFHSYSLNNTMLILLQYPEASLVAGYAKWQNDFNRNVNKGEKAIKILAPYEKKIKTLSPVYDEDGSPLRDQDGNLLTEEREIKQLKFRIVNVFDVSQTNGEPIPELIHDLTGTSDSVKCLIKTIKEVSETPILFKSTDEDETLKEGAKGYYHRVEEVIVVNKDLEDLQIVKTLAHEYAHSLLHKQLNKNQSQREIEAEALAFIICNHFGIDTSDYSFTYIATYAGQDKDFLRKTLLDIQHSAHEMIVKLEPIYERKRDEMIKDLAYITPVDMEKMSSDLVNRLMHIVSGTPIYDYLQSKNNNEDFGRDQLNIELNKIMDSIQNEFPIQYTLYKEDEFYKDALQESIFLRCYYHIFNPNQDRPFIENSIERENYQALESIAKPILHDKAYYMKLCCPHFMDLHIESIGDDKIALTHFYEQNGDLMADPTVELLVDNENKLLIPVYYQQDNLQIYQDIEHQPQHADGVNTFMKDWLKNIKANRFKIHEIDTENEVYEVGNDSYVKLKLFCEENNIGHMLPKAKEKVDKER